MKIFANKKFWKKIVIIFVLIDLFMFAKPTSVRAEDLGIGGSLMKPICSFTVGICDGIINVIHKVIMGVNTPLLRINLDTGFWWKLLIVIVAVIAIVGAVAIFIHSGGVAAPLLFKALGKVIIYGGILVVTGGFGLAAGVASYAIDAFWTSNDKYIDIPFYTISPEEIFRNELAFFRVNFFKDEEDENENSQIEETNENDVILIEGEKINVKEYGLPKEYARGGNGNISEDFMWFEIANVWEEGKTKDEFYTEIDEEIAGNNSIQQYVFPHIKNVVVNRKRSTLFNFI